MNEMTSSDGDVQQWIAELSDFRKRRRARQRLIEARAVQPLIGALTSANESVVWSAVHSLKELRAKEAVPYLVDMLDHGVLEHDVADALEKITGEQLGVNAGAWRDMYGSAGGGGGEESAAPATPEELVRRCGQYLQVEPTGSGNDYEFKLERPGGRHQGVSLHFGHKDKEGDDLLAVYSPCAPADEKHYEAALRLNLQLPAGALAIQDIEEKPHLVMVDVLLADAVHPRQLAKSIEEIADRADKLEQRITGQDKW